MQSQKAIYGKWGEREREKGDEEEGNGRLGDLTHNGKANKSELRA